MWRGLFSRKGKGIVSGSMRVVVTHQMQREMEEEVDVQIVMEEGKIVECRERDRSEEEEEVNVVNDELKSEEDNEDDPQDDDDDEDEDDGAPAPHSHSIITSESVSTGRVPLSVYWSLIRSDSLIITLLKLSLVITLFVAGRCAATMSDLVIGLMTEGGHLTDYYIYTYVTLILIATLLTICASVLCTTILLHGSSHIHHRMFTAVLHTSMQFFESNPIGRILNRFSRDQMVTDEQLPTIMLMMFLFLVIGFNAFVVSGLTSIWLYQTHQLPLH